MADPSPVRVALDISRADLHQAIASALNRQIRDSLDEAIRVFRSDISVQLDGTKDKVDRARTQMDGIQDLIRAKEDVIRNKLDELLGKVESEQESAKAKLKELEEEVNKKVVRYLVPVGLVFITSLVLGAVSIFGGFRVQDKIGDAVKNAQALDSQVKQEAIHFESTKTLLAATDGKIDEVTRQSVIGTNAKLVTTNAALQIELGQLKQQVDKLIQAGASNNGSTNSGTDSKAGKKKKGTEAMQ
jgi:hypothetical protein